MIELKNISKSFIKKNVSPILALSGVNISFPNKGLVSIVGKSGSGKTTLLNIVSGFLKPSSGNVLIDGIDFSSLPESEINSYRNYYFGFIFQDFNLFEKISVWDNIAYVLSLQNRTDFEKEKIITASMEKLHLEGMKDRLVETLSGGEKQRVAIARSIAKGSKVILADEPTGSLDDTTSEVVMDALKEISKEILVIMITHDKENAQKYSDRMIFLQSGKVLTIEDHSNMSIGENDFSPRKGKTNVKVLFRLSNQIVFEKRKKFLFTVFFWTFSLIFMMTSLSLLFVDGTTVVKNAVNENNISQMKLVEAKQLISGIETPFLFPEEDQSLFSNINFSKYYFVKDFYSIDTFRNEFSPPVSEYQETFFGNSLFQYIVITDEIESSVLPDGGIVITDFIAQMLIDNGIINVDSEQDAKGLPLHIDGSVLTITEVLETDYSDYISSDCLLSNDTSSCAIPTDIHFLSERKNEFVTIFMNQTTFNEIMNSNSSFSCSMNEHLITVNRANQLESIPPEGMIGRFPDTSSEIVLSMVFLSVVLGETVTEENLTDFLDQEVHLSLSSNEYEYTQTMTIVGITYSVGSEMFVNDTCFNEITEALAIDFTQKFLCGSIVWVSAAALTKTFQEYLSSHDAFFFSSYTNVLFFTLDSINSLSTFLTIISVVAVIVLATLMFYFSNNLVVQNRRHLGILMSIGMPKADIGKLVEIQSLKMLLWSFVLAVPLFYLIIYSLNQYFIKQANLASSIVSYSPLPSFISFLVSLTINLIAIILPIVNFSKTELINIIYDR